MDKAYLVNQEQISQLPMNGRNWIALMSTVPGMSSSAQSDFNVNFNDVSQFHGLGGRGSENNFYLDGSPNVDVGDNQSQYTQPSIDALGEFRVLQSAFNAEYGRAEGVAIAVQTKSGTAQFHGAAYEYLRNDVLRRQMRALQHSSSDAALQPVWRQSGRLALHSEAFDTAEQEAVFLLQPRDDAPQHCPAALMRTFRMRRS